MELISLFFMFSYVTATAAFPKPLSEEEERVCINEYMAGSEEAKNRLIEHNLRLVAHIAKKYASAGRDNEDYISVGTIGLIKAIASFNPEKGVRLATYAARCIENEILMTIRSSKKFGNEVYLNDPISKDKEGNEISIMDIIGSDADMVIEQVDTGINIKKMYGYMDKVLKDREITVLKLRYGLIDGKEMPQREIAKMLGISRSYVSRIEKKAIKKLRDEMFKGY